MHAFIVPLLIFLNVHPLHVSVTEVNFDEKDKSLEIMMRVFADDLETSFRKFYNQPDLDISNPIGKSVDELINGYIRAHVTVSLDKKQQPLKYLGHEQDGDAFVFYIEVEKVKKWKNIEFRNTVLTDTFGDQSNLIHVTVRNVVRTLRLNKDNPRGELTFD